MCLSNPSLSVFDNCRKSDLWAIAEHYGIPVPWSLVKGKFKTIVLDGLDSRGVFSLLVSGGDAYFVTQKALPATGSLAISEQPVTPAVKGRTAEKLVTLPHFISFSVESTPGSKADARLKSLFSLHAARKRGACLIDS